MTLSVLLLTGNTPPENSLFSAVIRQALQNVPHQIFTELSQVPKPSRLLLALSMGEEGGNREQLSLLSALRQESRSLQGCVAGMVVEAESLFFAKNFTTQLAFALNRAGCALVSSPLVEGVKENTSVGATLAPVEVSPLFTIAPSDPRYPYVNGITQLAERINGLGFRGNSPLTGRPKRPKLLAIHASLEEESNLSDLWDEVELRLSPFMDLDEVSLRQQTVSTCVECNLHHCYHFRPSGQCFYGGVLGREGFKRLAEADALLLTCKNYHNGLHPRQSAFLHYISDLFPKKTFSEKALYALIVSPYGGGDLVANQLIATLSLDNVFYLPPKFAMMETASQPMEALGLPEIEGRLDQFSHRILELLSLGHFS